MNRELYLEQLMKKSAYCKCPSLADLFEKRRNARSLEALCNSFRDNVDLERPMPQDEQFLRDYQNQASNFKTAVEKYQELLYQYTLDAKVYFELHEPEKSSNPRKMLFEEVEPLFKKNSQIIGIHCSFCDEQIDVFALNLK